MPKPELTAAYIATLRPEADDDATTYHECCANNAPTHESHDRRPRSRAPTERYRIAARDYLRESRPLPQKAAQP